MEASQITLVVSSVTALIGIAGFVVGYSQMKIASAKVKLDLYNRRFNIYLATLEYYQSAYGKTQEGMKDKAINFIKSYRESLFLFDVTGGIHETLGRIKDSGAIISAYKEAKSDENWPLHYDKKGMSMLHEKSVEAYAKFEADLLLLEK